MNEFLPEIYSETVRRLALGVEPTDPLVRSRIGQPVDIALDGIPWPVPARLRSPDASPWDEATVLRRVGRRDSCRHVLIVEEGVEDPVVLRIQDAEQRYVPRRLRIRLPVPLGTGRQVRPALFPGAAYGVPAGAVGVRGRIERGGEPLRWARIEARRAVDDLPVGFAHGDAWGEFLLLLEPAASRGADLILPLQVQVTVFGPDVAPDPDDFEDAEHDPLWDLPVEEADLTAAGTAVLGGRTLPAGYASRPGSIRTVGLDWHGLARELFDFS